VGLLSRLWQPSTAKAAPPAVEGKYRDGPYYLPITGGWLSATTGRILNWWQSGYSPVSGGCNAIVEACVSAYAQTIAMCPGDHWRTAENGGRERVTTSALSRFLRRPNEYQSISDFLLNATRNLYLDGNAYALALRNSRAEIASLHLMNPRQCRGTTAEDGSVFYALGGNEIIDRSLGALPPVPARDVLHIRLQTPRDMLRGESPLMAAALQMALGDAALAQQVQYFTNQARPSFVLSSDGPLTPGQAQQLREQWDERASGLNAGGTVVLGFGVKPMAIQSTAADSQLVEIMKLNDQAVAQVFGIPLAVLGIGQQTYSSTEQLMQAWHARGLGFAINHIEVALDDMFGLRGVPDEYTEFDTTALLRSDFKTRIEGLARGVQGGIYSPNEVRALEGLPPAKDGEDPRVQQQVVPLSAWSQAPPATPRPNAPAAPEPAPANDDAGNEDRRRAAVALFARRQREVIRRAA
jgi:HK97 family phage portal protein